MRRAAAFALFLTAASLAAGGGAATPSALTAAQREADEARERAERLDTAARRATGAAERARAGAEALAGRIESAEAQLTAAEARLGLLDRLQAEQRARLAERQEPVVRLTAALQTMARRPSALALVQPGSVRDTVHVRSLLAATLPEIRRRTAALRAEVERGETLRRQSEEARADLVSVREELRERRIALARFEAEQRARSQELTGLALAQSDRALAFGEEARSLARAIGTREYQQALAASLARLPGPVPRPGSEADPPERRRAAYRLPVEGRLLTGVGEISDGGVHARGLTFATAPSAPVVAPAAGRILYAGRFRSYGHVVIIDHGDGWTSVITDLAALDAVQGQAVARGAPLGRAGTGEPEVSVELRRDGRPVPIAQLIGG